MPCSPCPPSSNGLFYCNQEAMYGLLFKCAWATVDEFASDPKYLGAKTGATAVLHTWGRRMQYHPHVHMIIPSGGLTREGSWRRGSSKFFAPVKAMSKVFRGKLLSAIQKMRPALSFCGEAAHLADDGAFSSLISALYSKDWAVYCKKPFAGVGHVLHYLGRCTHRVAISNNRIASINDDRVAFDYRDAHDGDRVKHMTLAADEFIRRFLMHVLPKGFAKMCHCGILASCGKNERIDRCKRLTNTPVTARMAVDAERIVERMIGRKAGTCAHCGCRTVALPLMC